jgi:hypothetical protein
MANTKADVVCVRGVWKNVYSSASIAVGTAVTVTNKGNSNCLVAVSLAAPTDTTTGILLYTGDTPRGTITVEAGEVGLWALVKGSSTSLLVQEA